VNEDEPAQRKARRTHTQVAEGDVTEKGKTENADQGGGYFDIQEYVLPETAFAACTQIFSLAPPFHESQLKRF
jgi:hypothetical protein